MNSAAHPCLLALLLGFFFFLALAAFIPDMGRKLPNEGAGVRKDETDHAAKADGKHHSLNFCQSGSPVLSQVN